MGRINSPLDSKVILSFNATLISPSWKERIPFSKV